MSRSVLRCRHPCAPVHLCRSGDTRRYKFNRDGVSRRNAPTMRKVLTLCGAAGNGARKSGISARHPECECPAVAAARTSLDEDVEAIFRGRNRKDRLHIALCRAETTLKRAHIPGSRSHCRITSPATDGSLARWSLRSLRPLWPGGTGGAGRARGAYSRRAGGGGRAQYFRSPLWACQVRSCRHPGRRRLSSYRWPAERRSCFTGLRRRRALRPAVVWVWSAYQG